MTALPRIKPAPEMWRTLRIQMAMCKTLLQLAVLKVNRKVKASRLTHCSQKTAGRIDSDSSCSDESRLVLEGSECFSRISCKI